MTKCFTTALLLLVALVAVMLALADASASVRQLKTAERRELYRRYAAHKAEYDLDHGEAGSDEDLEAFANYEVTQELIRNQVPQVPDWAVFAKRNDGGLTCSYARMDNNVFSDWSDERFNDHFYGIIDRDGCLINAANPAWAYTSVYPPVQATTMSGSPPDSLSFDVAGKPQNFSVPANTSAFTSFVPASGYIDWSHTTGSVYSSTVNHLSSVDDQGAGCSSCWAYAFTSALESMFSIKGDPDIRNSSGGIRKLSVRQITSCSAAMTNFAECDPRTGMPTWALHYLTQAGSIIFTKEAFNANGTTDPQFCTRRSPTAQQLSNNFMGWNPTWAVCGYDIISRGDEQALAARLTYGPIIVGMYHGVPEFRLYTGPEALVAPGCSQLELSHSLLATGIVAHPCGAYWVVKNSWGLGWGIHGYLHLLAGGNQCGIATFAVALRVSNRYRQQWDDSGRYIHQDIILDSQYCHP